MKSPNYAVPHRDAAGRFSKRTAAGQELQPPGKTGLRPADPDAQRRAYAEKMDRDFRRAFPAIGKSTAARLRELHGQKQVSDYMPTPTSRRRA